MILRDEPRDVSNTLRRAERGEWHPANNAARKLWICLEAARDIEEILTSSDLPRRPRLLKILITPLHSLRVSVTQLGDYLCSAPDVANIAPEARQKAAKLLVQFKDASVFTQPADLKLIRDKLSAHVDRDIESWGAQEAVAHLNANQVGGAIHYCLFVLHHLLAVDVYAWTASDCPDGCVRVMNLEPSLVTLQLENGVPVRILEMEIARSPRYSISEVCQRIVANTQWMFEDNVGRTVPGDVDA